MQLEDNILKIVERGVAKAGYANGTERRTVSVVPSRIYI